MLTLKKPYDKMGTLDRLVRRVFEKGQRPGIPSAWPLVLRNLLKQGWDHDAAKRADMGTLDRTMKTLVGDVRDGCESVDYTISVTSQGETKKKSAAANLVRRYSSRVFEFSREMRPILRVSSEFMRQLETLQNSGTITLIAEDP